MVTVLEILSPANKRPGLGRKKYLDKRHNVLDSKTHLIEIDLLRKGEAMPVGGGQQTDYQILVSRSNERPIAERYSFSLREAIPQFLLPLDPEEIEPIVDLRQLLSKICQESDVDADINYSTPPEPALCESDFSWVQSLRSIEEI